MARFRPHIWAILATQKVGCKLITYILLDAVKKLLHEQGMFGFVWVLCPQQEQDVNQKQININHMHADSQKGSDFQIMSVWYLMSSL